MCVCDPRAVRVLLCVCVQGEGLLLMLLLLLTTFIFSLLTCQVLLQLEHSRRSCDHVTPPSTPQAAGGEMERCDWLLCEDNYRLKELLHQLVDLLLCRGHTHTHYSKQQSVCVCVSV